MQALGLVTFLHCYWLSVLFPVYERLLVLRAHTAGTETVSKTRALQSIGGFIGFTSSHLEVGCPIFSD